MFLVGFTGGGNASDAISREDKRNGVIGNYCVTRRDVRRRSSNKRLVSFSKEKLLDVFRVGLMPRSSSSRARRRFDPIQWLKLVMKIDRIWGEYSWIYGLYEKRSLLMPSST